MNGLRFHFLTIIFVCVSVIAQAADYNQNSVIVLPSNNRTKIITPDQKIVIPEKNQGQTGAVNQAPNLTVITPNTRQNQGQGVATPVAPDAAELRVSTAYAAHIFSSSCAERRRDELGPLTVPAAQNAQYWKLAQANCKCMAQQALAVFPAETLIDYVMFNYGYQDDRTTRDPQTQAYYNKTQNTQMSNFISSAPVRQKCGF